MDDETKAALLLEKLKYRATGYVPYYGERMKKDSTFHDLVNYALVHGVNRFEILELMEFFDDVQEQGSWGTFNYTRFEKDLRYLIEVACGKVNVRERYNLRERKAIFYLE